MAKAIVVTRLSDLKTDFVSNYNKDNKGHVYAITLSSTRKQTFTRQEMNKIILDTITWKDYKIKPIYAQ